MTCSHASFGPVSSRLFAGSSVGEDGNLSIGAAARTAPDEPPICPVPANPVCNSGHLPAAQSQIISDAGIADRLRSAPAKEGAHPLVESHLISPPENFTPDNDDGINYQVFSMHCLTVGDERIPKVQRQHR